MASVDLVRIYRQLKTEKAAVDDALETARVEMKASEEAYNEMQERALAIRRMLDDLKTHFSEVKAEAATDGDNIRP